MAGSIHSTMLSAVSAGTVVNTPGPRAPSDADGRLVIQMLAGLNRHDVNPVKIASAFMTADVNVQKNFAQILFDLIGMWGEMGEYVQPNHPLYGEYALAKKMVSNLFD